MQLLRQKMAPQPLQKRLVCPPGPVSQHSPVELLPNQATSRPGRMQESYDQILSGLAYSRPDQI
jgi:hypothetical protein